MSWVALYHWTNRPMRGRYAPRYRPYVWRGCSPARPMRLLDAAILIAFGRYP